MTREEEIRQAARKYFDDYMDGLKGEVLTVQQTFEDAANWADEHQNSNGKELLYVAQKTAERTKKKIISKACEWLLKGGYFVNNTETINDFKKAMEE